MNTNDVKEQVGSAKSRMADKWQDVQQRVSDKARNATQATHHYVKENTWSTLAMVAIASCIVGWFLRSSRED